MDKAIWQTKFTRDYDRNGQEVEILEAKRYKAGMRYKVRFSDGYTIDNAYSSELDFGY